MDNKLGSYPIIISTYLNHMSINYVMTAYFFSKENVMKHFEMTETQIGSVDACRFVGCVIGLILLFFIPNLKRIVLWYYAVNVIFFAVSLLAIPLLVYSQRRQDFWLYLIGFSAGIFKSSFWTLLLMIVHCKKTNSQSLQKKQQFQEINRNQADQQVQTKQQKQDHQRVILVLWTSSFDVGAILGFFGSNLMVYSLQFKWYKCIWLGVFMVITTLIPVIYFSKKNSSQTVDEIQINQQQNLQVKQPNEDISISSLICLFFSQPKNILFTLIFLLFHQILFERNMIYPDYLYKAGYQGYEGYLPSLCNIFSALGNFSFAGFQYFLFFILPKIFDKKANQQNHIQLHDTQNLNIQKQDKKHNFSFQTTIFLFIVCVINGFLALYEFNRQQQKSIWVMAGFLCAFSFFFGGPDNYYASYELVNVINTIKNNQPKETQKKNQQNINVKDNKGDEVKTKKNEGKQVSKQGLILNGIQILSFLLCIGCIITASAIVQKNFKYYFVWSFFIVLILFFCDLFRNIISLRESKEQKKH